MSYCNKHQKPMINGKYGMFCPDCSAEKRAAKGQTPYKGQAGTDNAQPADRSNEIAWGQAINKAVDIAIHRSETSEEVILDYAYRLYGIITTKQPWKNSPPMDAPAEPRSPYKKDYPADWDDLGQQPPPEPPPPPPQPPQPMAMDTFTSLRYMMKELYRDHDKATLKEMTTFKTNDGRLIEGKERIEDLSERQLGYVYNSIKKKYDEFKRQG